MSGCCGPSRRAPGMALLCVAHEHPGAGPATRRSGGPWWRPGPQARRVRGGHGARGGTLATPGRAAGGVSVHLEVIPAAPLRRSRAVFGPKARRTTFSLSGPAPKQRRLGASRRRAGAALRAGGSGPATPLRQPAGCRHRAGWRVRLAAPYADSLACAAQAVPSPSWGTLLDPYRCHSHHRRRAGAEWEIPQERY